MAEITREVREGAKALTRNPAVAAAFAALEQDIQAMWAATDLPDASSREIYYHQLLGLKQLQQQLQNWSRDTKEDGRQ
jgi:hypothetical protein